MANYLNSLYQTQYIFVDGKKVSIKEFKAMHKASDKKQKKQKKTTSINILTSEIKAMMKNINVLNSLVAYHKHAYKQWGTIATLLMGLKEIKAPFDKVVIYTKQINELADNIDKMAKANNKSVFQYIKKLSWKMDDAKTELDKLIKGVNSSGVLYQFGKHECINGTDKRLGLGILTARSYNAIKQLNAICKKLDNIEERGMDIFEYSTDGRKFKT